MRIFIIDAIVIISTIFIVRLVYKAIETGRARVRGGIIYIKSKNPISYWIVIIVQSLIVFALLCLLMFINFQL